MSLAFWLLLFTRARVFVAVLAHDGPDHGAQLGGVLAASAVANKVPVAPAELEFYQFF